MVLQSGIPEKKLFNYNRCMMMWRFLIITLQSWLQASSMHHDVEDFWSWSNQRQSSYCIEKRQHDSKSPGESQVSAEGGGYGEPRCGQVRMWLNICICLVETNVIMSGLIQYICLVENTEINNWIGLGGRFLWGALQVESLPAGLKCHKL